MARASRLEKLMLNLVNAARDRAGLRDLTFDGNLNESAEKHSEWMLRTDNFNHTGVGGSQPTERMREAGYRLSGTWTTGENIVAVPSNHNGSLRDEVREAHRLLMNSPSHRDNILKGAFQDVGIGIEFGKFNFNGTIADAVVITQNFARSSANNQIEPRTMAFEAPSRDGFFDSTEQNAAALSRMGDDFLF
jgi:serralysin